PVTQDVPEEKPAEGEKPKHTNRLAGETSPYLLQHAHNPVDWYPWGEEAFAKAKEEDKPIFLSIGYSTCHWCHVMERESFENEEMAAYLNEHYVCIKVDREERPDVDTIYMTAIQATGQGGGWPLSAFLNHDGRPFFLGTYFPPEDRYGRSGFRTVLEKLLEAWTERRDDIRKAGGEFAEFITAQSKSAPEAKIGAATLAEGVRQYDGRFDGLLGGFGTAPKFPRAHSLSFLLRAHARNGDEQSLKMVVQTLHAMARHFEKMLYDQATLANAYVEAWQLTGEETFARTARGIFEYVLRDLTHPSGGFYAAEDADSEGVEGKFYFWTTAELKALVPEKHHEPVLAAWGARDSGNFHGEAEEAPPGANILHHPKSVEEHAKAASMDEAALLAVLDEVRPTLLAERAKRTRPHLDDKVLSAWNGLMIGALARGARALDEPRYAEAAERAAAFLLENLVVDGRLHRSWREDKTGATGFLDDYAFLSAGLLDLHEATGDLRWLEASMTLADDMTRLFADEAGSGFWDTASDAEELIARTRDGQDWALPSGNSSAALLFLRLGRLTADPDREKIGRDVLTAFSGNLARVPMGSPYMLMALDFDLGPTFEVVLAGNPDGDDMKALRRVVDSSFLPGVVTVVRPTGEAGDALAKRLPWLKDYAEVDGMAAAYVCTGGTCKAPVTTPEALEALLAPTREEE
ncbi:MAG: thioredoxin domain-containing protein, partial [Planctomycetota bacterium]